MLGRYHGHSEAVIVSCFFNPSNSPYRLKAFNIFLKSIAHLEYRIVECVIGDAKPQLEKSDKITQINSSSLLWHKESLLNHVIKTLHPKFKYVFWVDADVIFTNKSWITDGVKAMKNGAKIIQPFEYCVHLEQDEIKPSFCLELYRDTVFNKQRRHPSVWKSFCSNIKDEPFFGNSEDYDVHGHVGFAWAAKREVLDECPLYEKALIGGADHIIAHAAAGQIGHTCISRAFVEDMDAINEWSKKFYRLVRGRIDYVKGDLYHIWHGDVKDRQYLKRIREFTAPSKSISKKDSNGLFVNTNKQADDYIKKYFETREVKTTSKVRPTSTKKTTQPSTSRPKIKSNSTNGSSYRPTYTSTDHRRHDTDDGFANSMAIGYMTNSAPLGMLGGNPMGAIVGEMLNNSENENGHSNHNHNVEHCDTPSHNHHHDGSNCTTDHHSSEDTSGNFS